jgi:hypothetical protein
MHKGMADGKRYGGYKEKMADMNNFCTRKSGRHLETRRMLKNTTDKKKQGGYQYTHLM